MSGIKCRKCGAIVTNNAAKERLAAEGMNRIVGGAKLVANVASNFLPNFVAKEVQSAVEGKSTLDSGVLAEQYNAKEYKCVKGHSATWVVAK